MTVAVVEADRVGAGVTGHTTAKLSSLHGLTYARLSRSFGEDGARAYGEANQAGIEQIAQWVEEEAIECDFRRKPNYTYTTSRETLPDIEREVEAAQRAGLPASYTEEADLPYPIAGAVRFEDQAEFHPRRFLLALADLIPGEGSHVFEGTRATGVSEGAPCRVETTGAPLTAGAVVVATHFPILDRGLYFARIHPERSYALGVRVRGDSPAGHVHLGRRADPLDPQPPRRRRRDADRRGRGPQDRAGRRHAPPLPGARSGSRASTGTSRASNTSGRARTTRPSITSHTSAGSPRSRAASTRRQASGSGGSRRASPRR